MAEHPTTTPADPIPSWTELNADEAIGPLLERFGPRIRALALRITGAHADADDIVQETFLQAYRKWDQFQGRSSPGTWLYTIAARLARKHVTSRRRASPRRSGAGSDGTAPAFAALLPFDERISLDIPSDAASPVHEQIRREAVEAVQDQIVRLPINFRLALVLKDVLELSVDEVAQTLGIKPATVKTRVFRARMMLRKALLESLPHRDAHAPSYPKQVCLDLLHAKLEAQNNGRSMPIGSDVLCQRCRDVFNELDLAHDACAQLASDSIAPELRRSIEQALGDARTDR